MQRDLLPALLAALPLLGGVSGAAGTARAIDTRAIEDQVDLIQVDRKLVAVEGASGRVLEIDLERGERVLLSEQSGRVAVCVTTSRLIGYESGASRFRELRLRMPRSKEADNARILLGDRVALVALPTRLAALGKSGWLDVELAPAERVELELLGESNVAAAVTSRRAIGFARSSGGFVEIALSPREAVESSSLEANSVTLITSRRVLSFSSGAVRWFERIRRNRR